MWEDSGGTTGCDVIIVGGGLAGLYTALKLAPLKVAVVTAAPLGEGVASAWAQGGIAAAMDDTDSPEAHAEDTRRAGAGIVDPAMATLLARDAAARIHDLLGLGVPFDQDESGHLRLSREAAHRAPRIVRVKGDAAGQAIMATLVAAVEKMPSIRVLDGITAHDLILRQNRVVGVRVRPSNPTDQGAEWDLYGRAVVLAAGGIGGLYAVTTNPPQARGEALAMAARAGAVIADAEFVQFHPTAIAAPGADPVPLATEALRGEGAILINKRGERFMTQVHEAAELAPRDIVARAVHREIAAGRGAFLDCREAIGDRFPEAFPTVYAKCRALGIDPVTEPIPVAPAAHYHMGGVYTDAHGRTTVDGLWATGEVASTGVHGANRLASNSLLEAVVFSARVAADISAHLPPLPMACAHVADVVAGRDRGPHGSPWRGGMAAQKLRRIMSRHVGVVRNRDGLVAALRGVTRLPAEAPGDPTLANMVLAAQFVIVGALLREESRGSHFREDFPKARPEFAKRSLLTLAQLQAVTREVLGEAGERTTFASQSPIHQGARVS